MEHGKGSELLDNQQRASRDDAKRNILFLMLNAGHPVCRSPIPLYNITKYSWKNFHQIRSKSKQIVYLIVLLLSGREKDHIFIL